MYFNLLVRKEIINFSLPFLALDRFVKNLNYIRKYNAELPSG